MLDYIPYYVAKEMNSDVFSFEPSVFNLEVLAKNININKLNDKITILPISLSEVTKFQILICRI